MNGLTISKRAWVGVVVVTALLIVAIAQTRSHVSHAGPPATILQP